MRMRDSRDAQFTLKAVNLTVDFMATQSTKILISLKNTNILLISGHQVTSKKIFFFSLKEQLNVDFTRMRDRRDDHFT